MRHEGIANRANQLEGYLHEAMRLLDSVAKTQLNDEYSAIRHSFTSNYTAQSGQIMSVMWADN